MIFSPFSAKQYMAMSWWTDKSPYRDFDALVCDGSIRAGKSLAMVIGFVTWAMDRFDGQTFALCGVSIGALRRNVVKLVYEALGDFFLIRENKSENFLEIQGEKSTNRFFLFGGKDERSAAFIQGITLAGVLFDEVALMPESFVNQAVGRCSIAGSKQWFNCNPEGPNHWFLKSWIKEPKGRKVLHLHFTMDDNLSLTDEIRQRYKNGFSGIFYQRFILGLWVLSDGVIYDMVTKELYYTDEQRPVDMVWRSMRTISCDYGTTNPCVFLDIYDDGDMIRVDREYRWDSKKQSRQKTDQEYADDLLAFMGKEQCTILVDPSAASFIAELRNRGLLVKAAQNDVLDGIRKTATLFQRRRLMINKACEGLREELGSYLWDEKASARGEEKPIKQNDHAPDALRYYVNSLPSWRFE